jgi:hypothetical protein
MNEKLTEYLQARVAIAEDEAQKLRHRAAACKGDHIEIMKVDLLRIAERLEDKPDYGTIPSDTKR